MNPEGQHLLAHELEHVKQQTGGATISMMPQEGVELDIDPGPQLEREADEAAKQALEDGPVVVNRMGVDMHIKRSSLADYTPSADGLYNDVEPQVTSAQTATAEPDELPFKELQTDDREKTIATLVENQRTIIDTLEQDNSSALESYGTEAGKGLVGSTTAGLVTMMTSNVVLGHVVGNAMSNMTAKAYDNHFDAGASKLADMSSGAFDKLDAIIDEKIRQRLEGSEYGGNFERLA